MSIIAGVTVNWRLSPRVIIIPDPITDITIEDLQDTLLDLEDDDEGMLHPHLRNTSGGEALGGGVTVGLTMELQNAQIYFEARSTPTDDGTGRTCDATNAAGTQLFVDDADFVTDGVARGHWVYNVTTAEMGTVTEVVDLNTLNHFALTGGAGGGWTAGDAYIVYPNVTASIDGGNLVAVDSVPSSIDPVLPAPDVQVVRSSSSSATQSDLDAIQFSSFGGGVTIDTGTANSGTDYPTGTTEFPVNNLADADTIADSRGFKTFFINSNLTVDAGSFDSHIFVGESQTRITLTVDAAADVINCEFRNCTMLGTLDGGSLIDGCSLSTLSFVNGIVQNCLLNPGTITLAGATVGHFLNCFSGVPGVGTPTINMGGSGQSLGIRNYNGGIALENKTGTDSVSIDLNSGQIVLASTVTNGTIVCRGIGKITDNSTGTADVQADDLLNRQNITEVNWDTIHVDTATGSSGTAFPQGTKIAPIDNMADALVVAGVQGIDTFHVHGAITLDTDYSDFIFISPAYEHCVITCAAGAILSDTIFENIELVGAADSGEFLCKNCVFPSGFTNLFADLENCQLTGTFTLPASGYVKGDRCTSETGATITANGTTTSVSMANYSGVLTITDFTNAAGTIGITGHYLLTLAASCTAGTALIAGIGILTDNSAGLTVTERTIPSTVWDETIASHTTAGTLGKKLIDVLKLKRNKP